MSYYGNGTITPSLGGMLGEKVGEVANRVIDTGRGVATTTGRIAGRTVDATIEGAKKASYAMASTGVSISGGNLEKIVEGFQAIGNGLGLICEGAPFLKGKPGLNYLTSCQSGGKKTKRRYNKSNKKGKGKRKRKNITRSKAKKHNKTKKHTNNRK